MVRPAACVRLVGKGRNEMVLTRKFLAAMPSRPRSV